VLKRLSSTKISPFEPKMENCLKSGEEGGRFLE